MSDANDDAQNYALAVLAGVVALVIGGVITLAASSTGAKRAQAAAQAAVPVDDAERVLFAVDSDELPADAMDTLARVAEAARANPNAAVLISGFHDASGDPARNADLAKRRAQAVQHALEANGVLPNQLVLDKPRETIGGSDARSARRVELRVR
jgi:outer membrane protein OmpA-like peptidoglycan-associated protein